MARMPCTWGRELPVPGRRSCLVARELEAPVGLWRIASIVMSAADNAHADARRSCDAGTPPFRFHCRRLNC